LPDDEPPLVKKQRLEIEEDLTVVEEIGETKSTRRRSKEESWVKQEHHFQQEASEYVSKKLIKKKNDEKINSFFQECAFKGQNKSPLKLAGLGQQSEK
jgi:uncharacterized membrane protein YgaE (UPF0421/DUF939 family)